MENSIIDNTKSVVPINWTEIQLPALKDIPLGLLTGESVSVNQKVLFSDESVKNVARHTEIVEYDQAFIKYQIVSVLAPILINYLTENPSDWAEKREELTFSILSLALAAMIESTDQFMEDQVRMKEIGLPVRSTFTVFMRSYKLYLKKKKRQLFA